MDSHAHSKDNCFPVVRVGEKDIVVSDHSFDLCGIRIPLSNSEDSSVYDLRGITSIVDTVHTANPSEAYAIIVDNEEAWLAGFDPSTGTFPGVVRGENGKIVEHPRWRRLGPDAIKAAKAVGMQILLISIAIEVHKIGKEITGIIRGLHNDRIAEMRGGINILRAALDIKDIESRNRELSNAAQTLNIAIEKNITSLEEEIKNCPSEKTKIFDAWFGDGIDEAKRKMSLAQESGEILSHGIQALALCYMLRTPAEISAAVTSSKRALRNVLEKVNFSEAHKKLALVAGGKDSHHSPLFWHDLFGQFKTFYDNISDHEAISMQPMLLRLK